MNARHVRLGLSALLLSSLASLASAGECVLQVRDGWVRQPPGGMPMLAGFGHVENPCPKPATIVGVRSPAFADVSLHETRIVDGVSRMRALPELRLAAHGTAELKPGGLHLMLMRPDKPLRPGDKVPVEFVLKEGGVLRGEFVVRKAGE